jgi:hypothetical protein
VISAWVRPISIPPKPVVVSGTVPVAASVATPSLRVSWLGSSAETNSPPVAEAMHASCERAA